MATPKLLLPGEPPKGGLPAHLTPGNPGNSGGKKGRSGRRPYSLISQAMELCGQDKGKLLKVAYKIACGQIGEVESLDDRHKVYTETKNADRIRAIQIITNVVMSHEAAVARLAASGLGSGEPQGDLPVGSYAVEVPAKVVKVEDWAALHRRAG